jgi:hypothetical protein
VSVIEAYVAELSGALRGPRRVKADLIAEARDSLIDAVEAHESHGLVREAAERRAVGEFGEVSEIVDGYQAELGLSQGRRTMLMIVLFLVPQHLVWENTWRATEVAASGRTGPGYALVNQLVIWFGGASIAVSLLAALACGIGVRYLGVRRGMARAAGIFALTVAGFLTATGLLLTLLGMAPESLLAPTGLPWTTAFLLVPMAVLGFSARRCLTAA